MNKELIKINDHTWEIPKSGSMNVPGRIIANQEIIEKLDEGVISQLKNVAELPGIINYAYCMPDGHWGYGFPIGGVAAFDKESGVVSPGGVGFDINCGMRLIKTNLTKKQILPKIKEIVDELFIEVPVGVGCKSSIKLNHKEFKEVCERGVEWCIEKGFARKSDLDKIESNGKIEGANYKKISQKAIGRGINQMGTLGSGNHYCEIQYVSKLHENYKEFNLKEEQVVIMVHCGSRGCGHQVASDYVKLFIEKSEELNIKIKDKELACAPIKSEIAQDYLSAMACAANAAFVNRQIIQYKVEQTFLKHFPGCEMELIYDVAHNIAKFEKYNINGEQKELLVHRKGSTRSLGPSSEDCPKIYKNIGQPVILGGSMETGSYLLVGQDESNNTFGSTAHGSGRILSRSQAKREINGEELQKNMQKKGIYVHSSSPQSLAEEAGAAYKDIDLVVDSLKTAGLCKPVAKLKPLGNIKG